MVCPNRIYTCREFLHEVNWKVVSPDSTVGIYIQYIYKGIVIIFYVSHTNWWKKTGSVGRQNKKKTINKKLAMDDALQIHINIIFVYITTTADVPTLYALVCFISLKSKDESNAESIILNIVASK